MIQGGSDKEKFEKNQDEVEVGQGDELFEVEDEADEFEEFEEEYEEVDEETPLRKKLKKPLRNGRKVRRPGDETWSE